MKAVVLALVAATALTPLAAGAQEIKQFNIGILGGENAQDRMNSTSGYLIPAAELTEKYGPLDQYFSEVRFSGGHEQTIVGVANGDFAAGVTWADGLGEWEDGYNSGALRRAADAGLVDMNDVVEIYKSKLIPEGPMVVRNALPQDVKDKVIKLTEDLHETDKACAYGVAAGEAKDFVPVMHAEYDGVVAARKLEEANN